MSSGTTFKVAKCLVPVSCQPSWDGGRAGKLGSMTCVCVGTFKLLSFVDEVKGCLYLWGPVKRVCRKDNPPFLLLLIFLI